MNPVSVATKAKGSLAVLKRAQNLVTRYSLSPRKIERALQRFSQILTGFDCEASFALTAVVLKRNKNVLAKYLEQNIEFVVHGYTHVDYSQQPPDLQLAHLRQARALFARAGIAARGFRSPYLQHNAHLRTAIAATGFSYVSNQTIYWDVFDFANFIPATHATYARAIDFYAPWFAHERVSIPRLRGQIVEIPVSLPDDEMLVDRLGSQNNNLIEKAWQAILRDTYQQGELFTLQLHPERIDLCARGLSSVLAKARSLTPDVWIARLNEIDVWWRAFASAKVKVQKTGPNQWQVTVVGPPALNILAQNVEILGPSQPWADGCRLITAADSLVRAELPPFVGASPKTSPLLLEFLRQQGYIVQLSHNAGAYPLYFDQTTFSPQDERSVQQQIEESAVPLLRLNRWPNGARSALCITGDIDAITLWDYALRVFGR